MTSVKEWYTGRLWSMTLSDSLRTVILCFPLSLPYYKNPFLDLGKNGNGYFPHRWGIPLFTPPPGSRARRLGWSQYMHECVGASQDYHGVVGGFSSVR